MRFGSQIQSHNYYVACTINIGHANSVGYIKPAWDNDDDKNTYNNYGHFNTTKFNKKISCIYMYVSLDRVHYGLNTAVNVAPGVKTPLQMYH